MLSLKHFVVALTLGAAILTGPAALDARTTHAPAAHPVSHKKKKHKPVHRKHGHTKVAAHSKTKPTALHSKTTKPIAVKTGGRHSGM